MAQVRKKSFSSSRLFNDFISAIHDNSPVSGLTHAFYRYPACFSPLFARSAIKTFSKPGDLVYDPFMGGGTTLVEARALGRSAMGTDISSLATFVSKVKTTILSEKDFSTIKRWAATLEEKLNLRNSSIRSDSWIYRGYQRNIEDNNTWPIRKTVELILQNLDLLQSVRQKNFIRCVTLRTGKWALDCRSKIPSAREFRQAFFRNLNEMLKGAKEFSDSVQRSNKTFNLNFEKNRLCINNSAIGIENDSRIASAPPPKLILTSPPYPGVHIVYHRWQVKGRRETPAPFWIANCMDSNGESYYTLGHRNQPLLTKYYDELFLAFRSISKIADYNTLLVQMVSFSEPSWQLEKYLQIMIQNGFEEIKISGFSNSTDGRLWRSVPNRKWYAEGKYLSATKNEVVLVHRLSR